MASLDEARIGGRVAMSRQIEGGTMRRIRQHLTYANVIATIAVFLVLGGGSAVALSGSNTVQSDDLGPGAQVKAADVAANAVDGQDVKDLTFQPLTLKNGWIGNCSGAGAPGIAKSVEGIVHLRGGICQTPGSSDPSFTVPAGFRPSKPEFLVVDLLSGYTGRIRIEPNGGFTSLAGVSYTLPF
jgi:hypothetical protein